MEADKALKQQMRSFKTYTIFNEFLAQFDEHRGRYKFMVIEGESCTGKSYFVRWMMGDPNLVLETNCASTPEPDLREYCPLKHKAVLFCQLLTNHLNRVILCRVSQLLRQRFDALSR